MKSLSQVFVLAMLFVFFASCEKKEDKFTPPPSAQFDIDEDGITDFKVEYSWQGLQFHEGKPPGVVGYFRPLDDNRIATEGNRKRTVWFEKNDTLDTSTTIAYSWMSEGVLVGINGGLPEVTVEREWVSEMPKNIPIVGLKLRNEDVETLAWAQFSLDPESGELTIVEKGLGKQNKLVIK